jgi:SAM-dependent MidA family methyltransferase
LFYPKGFHAEINLEAIAWLRNIADALKKGFVFTIDYGYPSFELYNHQRSCGTLACYYKHQFSNCPYSNIGEQDITAHVNFSALRYWGQQFGLNFCGFINQAYFMLSLGLTDHLRNDEQRVKFNDVAEHEKKFLLQNIVA